MTASRNIRLEKGLTLSYGACNKHKKQKSGCGYRLRHGKCVTFIFVKPHEGETAHTLMEAGDTPTIMPSVRCNCGAFQGHIIDGKFLHG